MNIDEWLNIPCDDDKHSSDDAIVVNYDSGKEAAEFAYRNQAFGNLNKFKGKVKISETRTICYSRDCDSDSVDTAEYIRGARGKGNKSTGKTRNRLIKEYSKVAPIQLKKTIEVNRIKRKIKTKFPLDENESCLEEEVVNENKTNRINHYLPQNDSETPPRIYNKMGRNRLESQANTVKTWLHSNSGSLFDSKHRYRTSWSSDSDPDDRILDNVRKIHKNITQDIIEPAIHGHSTTNRSAETIVEFPPEIDQQVVIDNHNKCAPVPVVELLNDSDEDVTSEEDILCMANSKRLLLYGKCYMKCGNRQASILYDRTKTDDYSTDDDLFRPQSYLPKAK